MNGSHPVPGPEQGEQPGEAELRRHVPVSPLAFEILVSLLGEVQHGYAILKDVDDRSGRRRTVQAGSLYRAMARLVEEGLVSSTHGPSVSPDPRRTYYRLTPLGEQVIQAEIDRLERRVAFARAQMAQIPRD